MPGEGGKRRSCPPRLGAPRWEAGRWRWWRELCCCDRGAEPLPWLEALALSWLQRCCSVLQPAFALVLQLCV